jgi:hypothetical protein
MNLIYFVSCWANEVDIQSALSLAKSWRADGIEGPLPMDETNLHALHHREVPWIAEIATGGGYVPHPHLTPQQHLDDLRRSIEAALPFSPILINTLAGSDAWSFADNVKFHAAAIPLEAEFGIPIALETHRSRPTFHPWVTRDLLQELPDLYLICDFSHWCAVTERLVMDEEAELLDLIASRARHLHARVGYAQGPQVPDPRAPEHAEDLAAHLRWWRHLVARQAASGRASFTITPEFGPDGYLQSEPFTQRPAVDLREVNHWMLQTLRDVTPLL